MRRIIILIALGLVAAACGSEGSSNTFAAPSTTVADSGGQTTADAGTTPPAPPADAATSTSVTPSASTPQELPDSDYPDVVVADLAGGEVNLRELALATEPVLLWFWAPH